MHLGNLCQLLDSSACRLGEITILAILVIAADLFRSWLRLRHIPGPRTASLTNLVRRSWVKTGDAHQIHTDLHRKYGTVVRSGPNAVMVSQPKAIDTIYGFKNRLEKVRSPELSLNHPTDITQSEFYDSIMPRIKGGKLPDIFATRDEDVHRRMRRPVARLFSVTNLTTFEPAMTSTMEHFFSRLDERFANKDAEFDLFKWIQFFMFDVLGQVTFSRGLGCLENGDDVDGIVANIWAYFRMVAAVRLSPV